jgi:hypothetical protein
MQDHTTAAPQSETTANEPRKRCTNPNCERVGQLLPLSEFYRNSKNSDKHDGQCKVCRNAHVKQWQQTDKGRDSHKIANRRYNISRNGRQTKETRKKRYNNSLIGKQYNKEKGKRYRESNRAIINAHAAVYKAVRAGRLEPIETLSCIFCKKQAKEYHHYLGYERENYLNVIPLCKKCHADIHDVPTFSDNR